MGFLTFSQVAPQELSSCAGTQLAVMLESCRGSPLPQARHEVHLEHPFGCATFSPPKRINGLHQPGDISAAGSGYQLRWTYHLCLA